jgi:hypothetical protein
MGLCELENGKGDREAPEGEYEGLKRSSSLPALWPEPSSNEEAALCIVESGSGDFSGSAVDSRDIPGNRILSSVKVFSRIGSS